MNLLGFGNVVIERALIRLESIVERARLALEPAEVEPAVRQVRVDAQDLPIDADRLRNPSSGAQLRRVAKQATPIPLGHETT